MFISNYFIIFDKVRNLYVAYSEKTPEKIEYAYTNDIDLAKVWKRGQKYRVLDTYFKNTEHTEKDVLLISVAEDIYSRYKERNDYEK